MCLFWSIIVHLTNHMDCTKNLDASIALACNHCGILCIELHIIYPSSCQDKPKLHSSVNIGRRGKNARLPACQQSSSHLHPSEHTGNGKDHYFMDMILSVRCHVSRVSKNMRSALLLTTKSLAAYWLGSADSWKQLHTNETSRRQISWVPYVYTQQLKMLKHLI